jgi:hypothetical protein
MALDPKQIKRDISNRYPSMPRLRKMRLSVNIIPAYESAVQAAKLLGCDIPPEPDHLQCDLNEDYIVLRDHDGSLLAQVYVGKEPERAGHVVLADGTELEEHQRHLLLGAEEVDGFIKNCYCAHCYNVSVNKAVKVEESLIDKNAHHVLFIPSVSKLKVTGVSDELAKKLEDSQIIADTTHTPKVVDYRPMRRIGSESVPSD